MMKLFNAGVALSWLATQAMAASDQADWEWGELSVTLPKAISDHTASLGNNGLIYLAGGCDSPNGNVYIVDGDNGFFACDSLSDQLYSFDVSSKVFETVSTMPRTRHRHSSAIVGDQVWLMGGRTELDELIAEIDVYDISCSTWTTVTLDDAYVVSDQASFALDGYVYIIGGYDQGYETLTQFIRMDASSLSNGTLVVEELASLQVARGDITAALTSDDASVFVTGGFTNDNRFCEPLGSTEEYSFASNTWTLRNDLVNARGEIVLVELNDQLLALGGERQIEGQCEDAGEELDPGELTVGTDEVELYDTDEDTWEIVSGFPEHKFRFAAVAANDGNVYAFGGQSAYDTGCQCFQTTNVVSVFGEDSAGVSYFSLSLVATSMSVLMMFLM
eukprot:Nitzschia sp. Nitz4//scaffold111_size72815//9047//10387//NITZ4_005779-RA/size72815-snap-gene-0.96-mRNA-1//1//CDS//3329533147//6849//frame0